MASWVVSASKFLPLIFLVYGMYFFLNMVVNAMPLFKLNLTNAVPEKNWEREAF